MKAVDKELLNQLFCLVFQKELNESCNFYKNKNKSLSLTPTVSPS